MLHIYSGFLFTAPTTMSRGGGAKVVGVTIYFFQILFQMKGNNILISKLANIYFRVIPGVQGGTREGGGGGVKKIKDFELHDEIL